MSRYEAGGVTCACTCRSVCCVVGDSTAAAPSSLASYYSQHELSRSSIHSLSHCKQVRQSECVQKQTNPFLPLSLSLCLFFSFQLISHFFPLLLNHLNFALSIQFVLSLSCPLIPFFNQHCFKLVIIKSSTNALPFHHTVFFCSHAVAFTIHL